MNLLACAKIFEDWQKLQGFQHLKIEHASTAVSYKRTQSAETKGKK